MLGVFYEYFIEAGNCLDDGDVDDNVGDAFKDDDDEEEKDK